MANAERSEDERAESKAAEEDRILFNKQLGTDIDKSTWIRLGKALRKKKMGEILTKAIKYYLLCQGY
ncbi:MAG: hypothetical protein AB4372_37730 [Xenococcus sp. (in: cyanobacteria)]